MCVSKYIHINLWLYQSENIFIYATIEQNSTYSNVIKSTCGAWISTQILCTHYFHRLLSATRKLSRNVAFLISVKSFRPLKIHVSFTTKNTKNQVDVVAKSSMKFNGCMTSNFRRAAPLSRENICEDVNVMYFRRSNIFLSGRLQWHCKLSLNFIATPKTKIESFHFRTIFDNCKQFIAPLLQLLLLVNFPKIFPFALTLSRNVFRKVVNRTLKNW